MDPTRKGPYECLNKHVIVPSGPYGTMHLIHWILVNDLYLCALSVGPYIEWIDI